ncbi:hypothetical protein [Bacillus pseudomycoides]|nr:hypothetical protein [Bacillus pseudomycoides]MED1478161.1 hypothetical protein [Bacillus pseudomycoides]MED1536413.1 hypothetical protein [Bacillus pseudomycoides]
MKYFGKAILTIASFTLVYLVGKKNVEKEGLAKEYIKINRSAVK